VEIEGSGLLRFSFAGGTAMQADPLEWVEKFEALGVV
jgi:hypothetical protein